MRKYLTNYLDRYKKRKPLDKEKLLEAIKMVLGKRKAHLDSSDEEGSNRSK